MNTYRFVRHSDNRIVFSGVDMGGKPSIVAENDKVIVLRIPGGKHWTGRGMDWSYHSPRDIVFHIDTKVEYPSGAADYAVTQLIEIDRGRKSS